MGVFEELLRLQPELAPDRRVEFPWAIRTMEKCGNVLDVACGGSIIQKYLISKGFDVVAIDIDKKLGAYYYNRAKRECFVLSDCFHPPFKNDSFDYILVISTVEHFMENQDDSKALKILTPLVRENGKILVSVPYGNHFRWLRSSDGFKIAKVYDDESLERLVVESGLIMLNKKVFDLYWEFDVACLELNKHG